MIRPSSRQGYILCVRFSSGRRQIEGSDELGHGGVGVSNGNPLIPNVTEELKETLEWAQSDTLWAPM